jgi:hypothetical protein
LQKNITNRRRRFAKTSPTVGAKPHLQKNITNRRRR